MTPEQETVAAIQQHIATLPPEQRVKINRMGNVLQLVIAIDPEAGAMALALLGAEMAAQA